MRDLSGIDRLALLKASPVLACLTDRHLEPLSQYALVRSYTAKERIFEQGDLAGNLFAVASGCVEISVSSGDGRRIVLRHIGPGEVFGEIGMLDGLPRTADAIAHEITLVVIIQRRDFLAALESEPSEYQRIIELLCHRLRLTTQQVEDSVFLTIERRLAKALLKLAGDFGDPDAESVTIGMRISQTDLAAEVGATRESINKIMTKWKERGAVDYSGPKVAILNKVFLTETAEGTAGH